MVGLMLCFGNGAEALAWGIMFVVMPLEPRSPGAGNFDRDERVALPVEEVPRLVSGGAAERTANAGQIE